MIRLPTHLLAMPAVILAVTAAAQAGEFNFMVKIDLADCHVCTEETAKPPTAPKPRPVVDLTCGKSVRVSWRAENTSKSEEFKDVLVHFFVVGEKKTGQVEVPTLTKDVTYEGALTMDFKPREVADWQWTLKILEPGSYLLRVETIGLKEKHGHEYYAALDLVVK